MTALLTAADLIARLRSGVHAEPPAVEIDWRSEYIQPPVFETGFDPETGDYAGIDATALSGTWLLECRYHGIPPNRGQYTIRPAVSSDADPS